MSMRRGMLAAALVAAGSLVALGLVELALRLTLQDPRPRAFPADLITADAELGWRLTSAITVSHAAHDFEVIYETNDLGYRDRPRTAGLAAGWRRVLLHGDSQVFGWGVAAADRFSDLIEAQADDLEVWNLAVPGYGLDQQVLAYEAMDQLPASYVVFLISQATLHRLRYAYLFGLSKPFVESGSDGRIQVTRPAVWPPRRAVYRLPRWMVLPYWLDETLQGIDDRFRGAPRVANSLGVASALLRHAAAVAASRRHRPLVLLDLPEEIRAALEPRCATLGIDVAVLDVTGTDMVFGGGDLHWTRDAHARIARYLMPVLDGPATP